MPTTHSQDQVSLRTWMGLGILMVPVLLVTISHTTLYFALPVISEALAPNAELLLAARIAMGVFGAVILPATHSLIRTMFEERKQRRLAIAIWSTGFAGGAAIGPLVGGWLIVTFGWPAVFLIAIPLLVVLAVGAPLSVRESRDPDPGRLDVVSIIRSAVTLAPIIAAIKRTVEHDLDLLSVGMGMISLIAGVLFVVRLLRIPNPMLDLRLLKRVGFTGPVLINLISGATMTWFLFFAAQHLQLVPGLSPLQAAWVLIPGAAVNILAGLAVVRIVRRFRFGTVMATGLFCSGLAYLLLALTSGHTTILAICLMYMLIGLGIGSAETLSNDLMMANIPREKAGSAAAVSETSYELGTVLGVTILGGILSATYRAALEVPDTLSAGQAAAAEQTLAGAVETGHGLSGPSGEALVSAAAAAFGTGTYLTALVCAIAMIVISTGTYVALRRERG